MHSDPDLVERLFQILPGTLEPRIMFGGQCWMLNGNMCVGVYKEYLILRVGQEKFETLLEQYDELRPMDITGKPMKGWGMIDGVACDDESFSHLVDESKKFVGTLPKKLKK
jgi:hypothetical protein